MALEYKFRCPLPNGLHARPASYLAETAGEHRAQVTLHNERSGVQADAKSVLDLVAANVMLDDSCTLVVDGPDEQRALAALAAFIEKRLPACDEALPEPRAISEARLPRVLENENTVCLAGVPVSPGTGCGCIVAFGGLALPDGLEREHAGDPAPELEALETALAAVQAEMQGQLYRSVNPEEQGILRANLAIVRDTAFVGELQTSIMHAGCTALQAIVKAVEKFTDKLNATGSVYLRERIVDLQDIGAQLLERVSKGAITQQAITFNTPSVVCAPNLAPRQLLALDRQLLRGLVLTDVGATSHAVILARSFGIPVLTGLPQGSIPAPGVEAVVDADRGLLISPVTPAVRRFYEKEHARECRRQARFSSYIQAPAQTLDGWRVEISANIATAVEAAPALASGADGVGLFRTEMVFSGRDAAPSEDEQFLIYKSAVEALPARKVIIRTIDIGGDKPLPYLNLPQESNPFLGYRGLRMYEKNPELITAQLRAICRASAFGLVWVMAPMVSTVDEACWFKERVAGVQAQLTAEGIAYDAAMPVGIMVEVPAVALMIDKLSAHIDFFSIGTNDLCQYLFAADRGNRRVAPLCNVRHPAFLRLLKQVVDSARANGKWIGMCGEMAREAANTALLIGLGLEELSLVAPNIPAVKTAITKLDSAQCTSLLEQALACPNAAEVDGLLAGFQGVEVTEPLLDQELILLGSDSQSKEEAIKELADLLYVNGRTSAPVVMEDEIWARETVYSTGLGHGIAIPHCKTDRISANSLCLLKLDNPIEWGALDNKPVELVILLAIRATGAGDAHLRILSRLARKLMDENFRQILLDAKTSEEIVAFLTSELEINHNEV